MELRERMERIKDGLELRDSHRTELEKSVMENRGRAVQPEMNVRLSDDEMEFLSAARRLNKDGRKILLAEAREMVKNQSCGTVVNGSLKFRH